MGNSVNSEFKIQDSECDLYDILHMSF